MSNCSKKGIKVFQHFFSIQIRTFMDFCTVLVIYLFKDMIMYM